MIYKIFLFLALLAIKSVDEANVKSSKLLAI